MHYVMMIRIFGSTDFCAEDKTIPQRSDIQLHKIKLLVTLLEYAFMFILFQLGPQRIHLVRTRGGNVKHRALRLDTGNFSWGSECKFIIYITIIACAFEDHIFIYYDGCSFTKLSVQSIQNKVLLPFDSSLTCTFKHTMYQYLLLF